MRFSANLSFLYQDIAFLDRFAAAAHAGFLGVEFASPYGVDASAIVEALRTYELQAVLFNLPSGNAKAGDRGIACQPDRITEFREGVLAAADYAPRLGTRLINCLAGIADPQVSPERSHAVLIENLQFAADVLAEKDVVLLVEALNTVDSPGFFVHSPFQAKQIVEETGRDNVGVQLDFYHTQMSYGNLQTTFDRLAPAVRHIQVGDVPGRHEFAHLERAGYTGWIGCEYVPLADTDQGLRWMTPYDDRILH